MLQQPAGSSGPKAMAPARNGWWWIVAEGDELKNAGDGAAGDVGVGISSAKTEDETD